MGLRNLLSKSSASVSELRNDAKLLTQMAGHFQTAADEIEAAERKAAKVGNDPSDS